MSGLGRLLLDIIDNRFEESYASLVRFTPRIIEN